MIKRQLIEAGAGAVFFMGKSQVAFLDCATNLHHWIYAPGDDTKFLRASSLARSVLFNKPHHRSYSPDFVTHTRKCSSPND